MQSRIERSQLLDDPVRCTTLVGQPLARQMPQAPAIDWQAELAQHKSWLHKVLRSRVGDRHEVEDLFQEIALKVLRQSQPSQKSDGTIKLANTPNDPEKVAPWLYRLAVRQTVDFHRRINRKSQARPDANLEPYSNDPQPLDWMLAKEQTQNLQTAMEQLKPQHREVLALKYAENWSYKQIAKHLGVSVRTVEQRLFHARNTLRKNLAIIAQSETPKVTS